MSAATQSQYTSSMPLTVHLLGEPHVEVQGRRTELPPHRPVFLLIYLACAGDWVRREELLGVFWPDELEVQARRSLRVLLNRAKAFAWAQGLESEPLRLRLRVPCDVQALRTAFSRSDWETVVRLHRQPLLAGFPLANVPGFEAWCEAERDALLTMWRKATLQHAADLGAAGDHARAAALLGALLAYEPLAEDVLGRFLEQAYLGGDRDGALRGYTRFRDQLGRELGLEPLAHTQELFLTVQRAERLAVAATPATAERVRVPLAVYRPPRVVGRAHEAARARGAATPAVLVAGEPGVGKTRLLEELVPNAVWCRCREGLANLPYAPVVELIRADLGRVPELGSYREDLARLVPEVAPGLVPGPLEPLLAKARLTEALARWCEALGAPVVFDDLQWADPGTLELFVYLANRDAISRQTGLGTGLYGAYRHFEKSESLNAALAGLRAQGLLTEVPLAPLLAEEVRELVGELIGVPEGPVVFSRWLFGRSRGNPLFALETLKSLFETGVLQARGGGWHTHLDDVTRDYSELDVPPKIAELVTRRVANLSAGAQRVLQAVSVVGEGLSAARLARVLGLSELDAVDALESAEAAGLVEGGRFAHDLLRQSVYAALSPSRRRYLHAGVAAVLAATADPLVTAEHWLRAGNPEQAARYFAGAAESYLARGLPQEALGVLGRAQTLDLSERERAVLSLLEADGLLSLKRYDEAARLAAALLERREAHLKTKALILQTFLALRTGRLDEALAFGDAALALAAAGAPELYTEALLASANVCALSGRQESVIPRLEAVLRGNTGALTPRLLVQLHSNLAWLYCGTGRFEAALPLYERAVSLAETHSDRYWWVWSVANWLYCCLELGRPAVALPLAERALPHRHYDASEILAINVAKAYLELDRVGDALNLLERLLADCDDPSNCAVALGYLADLYHRTGQPDAGALALQEALYLLEHTPLDRARARVTIAALAHGSAEQREQVLGFVPDLNPRAVPSYVWRELQAALAASRTSRVHPPPAAQVRPAAAQGVPLPENSSYRNQPPQETRPPWAVASTGRLLLQLWLERVTPEGVQEVQRCADALGGGGAFACLIFVARGCQPPALPQQLGLVGFARQHHHKLRGVVFVAEDSGLRGNLMRVIMRAMAAVVPGIPVAVCEGLPDGLARLAPLCGTPRETLERELGWLLAQAGRG